MGTGDGEAMEERMLNRIIRITAAGWQKEAGQRHAYIIVEQLNPKGAE